MREGFQIPISMLYHCSNEEIMFLFHFGQQWHKCKDNVLSIALIGKNRELNLLF